MKFRFQVDLTEGQLAELDSLKNHAGAESRAELVRDALRLYRWALDRTDAGFQIYVQKGKKKVALELLTSKPLSAVK